MKTGEYEPRTQEKGKEEAFIDGIKEGQIYWCIQIAKEKWMDVKNQETAEIISMLVRVEKKLDKLLRKL